MEKVNTKITQKFLYFLAFLAVIRPSFDILSQYEFRLRPDLPAVNINIVLGGLIFLIGIIFVLKNLRQIFKNPLVYPILLFLGLSFLSIFYSIDATESAKELIRLSSIFLLYFISYGLIQDEKDFNFLVKAIFISYLVPAAFAIFQFLSHQGLPDDFGGFNRIYSTFAHPNPFAFYTFFVLAIAFSFFLVKREETNSWIKDNPYLWLIFALALFLLATYTRTALASLLIFIVIFGIFKYKKVLMAGVIFFILAYLLSDILRQRIWELAALDPYGSVVWRLRLWKDMFSVALWHPWLGYGLGAFEKLTEFYRGFKLGSLEAHNDFLKIFVENGLIGLASYFLLLFWAMTRLFKTFRKALFDKKILALGILSVFAVLSLISFFDNVLRVTALQWNLWILVGAWLKINKPRL
ncbi:MAG: O-antigen ligase family protein [Patescibacteria group bacterium]